MSRNGSGTYSLPAGNPVVTGTTITSTWANSTLTDIASALTQSVSADGQTPMTGSLNMASNKIIALGTPTASTDAVTKAYADALIAGGGAGVFTSVTDSGLTSGRVTYATTGGLLTDSSTFTYDGTTVTSTKFAGAFNGTLGATTPTTAVVTSLTDSGLTTGRVTYATTGGLLTDSANLTFNGTTLTTANDASISGLTVGKGGGASDTNAVVGKLALTANTTGVGNSAFNNGSLYNNTTGGGNSAYGYFSLLTNTTGSYNTAVGNNALVNNTTASSNTAVGYQAGYNSTGTGQNCFGYQAGYGITSGTYNHIFGHQAGYNTTTGNYNSFFGASAGYYVTTGSKNTILGSYTGNQGGLDIRTASNYIVLSDGDGNPRGYFNGSGIWTLPTQATVLSGTGNSYAMYQYISATGNAYIDSLTNSTGNSQLLIRTYNNGTYYTNTFSNTGAAYQANNSATWSITSDIRIKDNIRPINTALDKIISLSPCHFEYKNSLGKIKTGFIAQEFEKVFPGHVYEQKTPEEYKEFVDGSETIKSIDADLIPYLVKAIQELKAEVDSLKAQLGK